MRKPIQEFLKKFPKTEVDKPLAPLCTFHIGGPADLYQKITNLDDLPAIVNCAQKLKLPVFILGGGSNTIFADKGFRGLILHMQAKKIAVENGFLTAETGASLSQIIQFALKHNLSGLEKLMGLPGTIGGAVTGNAGAFGTEIKDVFAKALIYSNPKGFHEVDKNYMNFQYRSSIIKKSHETILKVYLELKRQDCTEALAEALDILKSRVSKQPKGYCSGSFFKNPSLKLKAGYLLEQAGCKGLCMGQIKVSEQHANWLINLGDGTQKDVVKLAVLLRKKVKNRFNVNLEKEVCLVKENGRIIIN